MAELLWSKQFYHYDIRKWLNRYEGSRRVPWKVTDAPADYIDKQVGGIVGLEMPITRLIGKWKMSQNRPAGDRDGAARSLLQEGGESTTAAASLIRQSKRELRS